MTKFYALNHDSDDTNLTYMNVIREDTIERIKKELKKTNNFKSICEIVRSDFIYHYWSKCEYEFIASNWTGKEFEQKIDVYKQLQPNVENITKLILLDMKYIEHNGKIYKFKYKELIK